MLIYNKWWIEDFNRHSPFKPIYISDFKKQQLYLLKCTHQLQYRIRYYGNKVLSSYWDKNPFLSKPHFSQSLFPSKCLTLGIYLYMHFLSPPPTLYYGKAVVFFIVFLLFVICFYLGENLSKTAFKQTTTFPNF